MRDYTQYATTNEDRIFSSTNRKPNNTLDMKLQRSPRLTAKSTEPTRLRKPSSSRCSNRSPYYSTVYSLNGKTYTVSINFEARKYNFPRRVGTTKQRTSLHGTKTTLKHEIINMIFRNCYLVVGWSGRGWRAPREHWKSVAWWLRESPKSSAFDRTWGTTNSSSGMYRRTPWT